MVKGGGSDGERVGEYSARGKMGSTFEVRDSGEEGRGDVCCSGGVVEPARGVAWLEEVGERPGEEGWGLEWLVEVAMERGRRD